MARWSYFYLIRIEFLGFRYHGWQKQPKYKSVQGMVDKTFEFIFQHENFKTHGCGRTDAKVSANDFAFELFVIDKIDTNKIIKHLNKNLPSDIRAKTVVQVNSEFRDNKASDYASQYAKVIGQLPAVLRKDIQTVWIHKGNKPFGGGNQNSISSQENKQNFEQDSQLPQNELDDDIPF